MDQNSEKDPTFKGAFERAKKRISQMNVRILEERDPIRQYLLEIFVAMSAGGKYNDFDTH